MISPLYRGSVKDLFGPVPIKQASQTAEQSQADIQSQAVIFEYSDAFSVFDWGRMPDALTRKGEALAILAAEIFERLEKPESWREYSKTSHALALRKANRFGGLFNEYGEELQAEGLRTHYLGVLENLPAAKSESAIEPKNIQQVKNPFRRIAVKQVSVVKPSLSSVLGRVLPDYHLTRASALPRLIPLEVIFRMSCPDGSSLLERVSKDPNYLASIGFPEAKIQGGVPWEFPVLELFTKLEPSDRPVSLSESLAISGLTAKQLQEMLFKTAWVAGLLKFWFSKLGIELADGKLEWAVSEEGRCFLVDAIGPDELRLLKNGNQLSKEFLRSYYRTTSWFHAVEKAKSTAKAQGIAEWKRLVSEAPPALPSRERELAIQVYLALANDFTGKKWFPDAWSLGKVTEGLKELRDSRSPSFKKEDQSTKAPLGDALSEAPRGLL